MIRHGGGRVHITEFSPPPAQISRGVCIGPAPRRIAYYEFIQWQRLTMTQYLSQYIAVMIDRNREFDFCVPYARYAFFFLHIFSSENY